MTVAAVYNNLPPALNASENAELVQKYIETGDPNIKEQLITGNMGLVFHIVNKFKNSRVDVDDMISVGTFALMKAINSFKPDKSNRLSTYATICIRNEIMLNHRKSRNQFKDLSFETPVMHDKDGESATISETLQAEGDDYEERTLIHSLRQVTEPFMVHLEPREKQIMHLLYNEGMSQQDAGDVLGVSRSWIQRLHGNIIQKLRDMAITTDLMDKPPEDRPRDTSRKLKELRREMATIDIRKVKWLLESTALTQVQIAEMLGASTVAINKWAKRLQKSEMSGVEPDATTAILLEQYVEALNPDQRQKYEDRKRRMREAPSEVKVSYLPNHPNYAPLEPVVSAMDEVAVTAEAPVLTEPEPVPTEELRAEDETTTSNPSISISLGGASTDRIADFLECFMLQLEKGKTYRFEISASEE